MSRPDMNYWGSCPTNAAPQDILNLLAKAFGEDAPLYLGEIEWTPSDWRNWCDINLTFEEGTVYYSFSGNAENENADEFLDALQLLATTGWESREGDEYSQDDDCMVTRGPNPRAIAAAELVSAQSHYDLAADRLQRAQKALDEHR